MDFEQAIHIARSPAAVFAFLDDFANVPRWNRHCVRVEQVTPGPHASGTKLRYFYSEGQHEGEMAGIVSNREPDRQLSLTFTDAAFEVIVGFALTADGATTRVVQSVAIKPRSLLIKLASPLLRVAMKQRFADESERLKKAVEESSSAETVKE